MKKFLSLIVLLLLTTVKAQVPFVFFYSLHDSLIYEESSTPADTLWLNFTSFNADENNVDQLINPGWNNAKVNSTNSEPPQTILSEVYTIKGDTLGPLLRVSPLNSSQSWFASTTYIYSEWPVEAFGRGVETADTLSFTLAGFKANQELYFRIFGGAPNFTPYADEYSFIVGDSINTVTDMRATASNHLADAYGYADGSGVVTFKLCSPGGDLNKAAIKALEIITAFPEGGGPGPGPGPSPISARVMDIDNIDLFTDDNLGWQEIYEGEPTYENFYPMDGLAIFDQQDNDWDGTTFNGIKEDGIQRGLQLKFESSKKSMKFPWQMHYWLKQPIQIDSIGFFNNDTWGNEGQWNDIWFKISGATTFGDWIVLFDSIRGTNTDEMVWRAVNTADSIKYLQVIMDKVDRNGISASEATGNVTFTKKLSVAIIGDKAQPDTLPDLPENFWKTGLTYRERLSVNDLQDQDQDSLGTYFSGHRFYDNLSNWHLRSPGSKWVIEPNMFSSEVLDEVDARGDTVKILKWYSSRYLSDRRNGGSNFNLITLQRGWKLPLTDDFDVEGNLPLFKKTSYTYLVRDSSNYSDTNRYTTTGLVDYDYRDTIFDAWHNTDLYVTRYDTALLSDLANSSDYLGDTTFKINALDYGFPFEDPLTWVKMGDPTKRDSIMTAPETWKHMAELFFAMSAIYGDVEVPKSHVDQYLEPGQLYRTGMGVLDAISKHQEPNKDWEGAQAHWKPQWVAMFLSVAYDGHLGTVCDTCGMFAADSSMYISYGGDMRLKGNHAIETWEWLMYFRNQVWDTLSSKVHPYSGDTMRLAPKIHMDTHHYFATTGGQGSSSPDFLFPTVESTRAIEPEHPFFWQETEEFLKWANVNLPSDARIEMSEYAYGPNSGAPFSLNKDDIKITAYGTEWWPTAALSGGTGADSIDMGLDAYAVALEKRAEQLFWRHGWPYITKFQIRDVEYDKSGTLNGGAYQPATDSSYWTMNGNSVNQFDFMGVFKKSGGATRVSDQTYHWLNVAETMKDYELWEIETETDTVYSYIWRSTVDTTKYIKRVWRPTIVNDTTYNYTINFPQVGTSSAEDVVQINCYLHSFDPVIDSLGDITSYQTDIIEIEKMFGYTYVPIPTDSITFTNGDTTATVAENTVWQKLGVLSGGVGDYRIDQEYGVGSWLRLRGDTVMNGVTFNYELQYTSNTPPGNPKFKVWDSNDSSQVFTIVVTNVTGAYDQNALIPDQAHADSLNSMIGWNKFQVGDYHIVNNTNANGGIYQLSLPNMGANKNIYISGFFTDVSFVFNNITGRDTSNQVLFSNGLGQFRYDGTFGNINPKGIRFTGKYDQSIRTGDTGYAATVHDTWKHGNFGINRNARHSPVDADFTFAGFNLQKYFSDIEIDHIETHGGGYAGFDLKQDNPKNLTNTGDSVYVVHNLWVHDVYGHELGELIYLGNTKAYPQHFFKNWKIYNILGVRTNYELFQVQRGLGEGHAHNFVGIGAGNWNDAFQVSQGGLFQITPAEPGNLIVEKAISSGGGQDQSILLKPYNNEMDSAIADGIINLADTFYSKNSDTVRFRDILVWRARHQGVIYANSRQIVTVITPENDTLKIDSDIRPDNYASFKAEKIFVSKQQVDQWSEVDTSAQTLYFWNYDNWMTNQDAIFDSIIMDTTILGLTNKTFTDTSNIYRLNEVTEPEFENPWAVESLTPSAKSSLTTKLGGQSNWLGFTLEYIQRQSRWTTGVWENAQNIDELVAKGLPPGYCTLCPIEYKVHDIVSDPVVDTDGQFGHGHYWRLFYCVQDHNSDTGDRPREDTDESHWIELGWVNDRGNYQPLPPDDYNTKVGTFYYNREMGLIEPDAIPLENSTPFIEITTPGNNTQILRTTFTVAEVTAIDTNGRVDSVVFFVDGVRRSVDTSPPYNISLPVDVVGTFKLKATVYDNSFTSSSDSINYSVYQNILPTVNITSPPDGEILTIDTFYVAEVTATDLGSIDSVTFFINDTRQSVDLVPPYQYVLPTNNDGGRELKAIAYDDSLGSSVDSLIYYINDTTITAQTDTIYINWTAFVEFGDDPNDVSNVYWNNADVRSTNSSPPDTILTEIYSSFQNDTVGPLVRVSDSSSYQSWFNDAASPAYSEWPDAIRNRGVRTNDTLSFTLGGFDANQEVTFRIFGGSNITFHADTQSVVIGDSVNIITGLRDPTTLSSAYGTADNSGVLSFSICCPQSGAAAAYWKGMEIITAFAPPPPCQSVPTVDIVSPSNNQNITLNTTTSSIITASDDDGIDSVVFFIDDVRMAVDLSSPFSYNLPTSVVGTYEFKAVAYDTCSQSSADSINFNVIEESSPVYSNAQFCEKNGLVVMEAENLNIQGTSWEIDSSTVGNRAGWTGTGYIAARSSGDYSNFAGNDVITTTIQITNPGVYRVMWRNRAGQVGTTNTSDQNDSWLKFNVPNGDFYAQPGQPGTSGTFYYPAPYCNTIPQTCPNNSPGSNGYFKIFVNNGVWDWKTATSDFQNRKVYVNFDTAGTYEMYISIRSRYHEIDRIVLYKLSSPFAVTENNAQNLEQPETECAPPSACAFSPTVKITSQTAVNEGSVYNATVNATDNDGIDSVVFFIDDVRQSVDINSPYTYSLPTSTLGTYEFKAVAYDTCSQSGVDSINYTVFASGQVSGEAPNFPGGRIALLHDGNQADADDIGAMPMMFFQAYYAGLIDTIVWCGYSNLAGSGCRTTFTTNGNGTFNDWCEMMDSSAAWAQNVLGANPSIFHDINEEYNAASWPNQYDKIPALDSLVTQINASSASNPLWILAGAPHDIIWRALRDANASKHQYVWIISHSAWNEDATYGGNEYTFKNIQNSYPNVNMMGGCIKNYTTPCLEDQNHSVADGATDADFRDESGGTSWNWMYANQQGNAISDWLRKQNVDAFFINKNGASVDWSDAGMMWFLLSGGPINGGDQQGTSSKVKYLFDNGQMPD